MGSVAYKALPFAPGPAVPQALFIADVVGPALRSRASYFDFSARAFLRSSKLTFFAKLTRRLVSSIPVPSTLN